MQRKTPLYVDHFGWATMDEPKTVDFFEKMGFFMGDKRPEGDKSFYMSHFYFDSDSSYINIYQLPEDGNMWPIKLDWVQKPDKDMPIRERLSDPRGVTGVYTFCISTRDCDESYAAAVEAGYKVCQVYRRPDPPYYYTTIGGSVQDDMFAFDLGVEPFPNMMIGVMEHCDQNWKHAERSRVHEYHANGVNKISSLVLYYETEEELMNALKAIHKMHDTMKDAYDYGNYTREVRLVDKAAYEKEFGVEAPHIRSNVVAIEFQNGDLDYIREQADKNGFHWFERNGKVYVDGRDALNAFLIFE